MAIWYVGNAVTIGAPSPRVVIAVSSMISSLGLPALRTISSRPSLSMSPTSIAEWQLLPRWMMIDVAAPKVGAAAGGAPTWICAVIRYCWGELLDPDVIKSMRPSPFKSARPARFDSRGIAIGTGVPNPSCLSPCKNQARASDCSPMTRSNAPSPSRSLTMTWLKAAPARTRMLECSLGIAVPTFSRILTWLRDRTTTRSRSPSPSKSPLAMFHAPGISTMGSGNILVPQAKVTASPLLELVVAPP